jgi:putative NADH-flavin reductase
MATIAVIGATGYAGRAITSELVARGHQVIGASRRPPDAPIDGVEVRIGSIEDPAFVNALAGDASVVVVSVHALADGTPMLPALVPMLLDAAGRHGARLGFVGGAGSLRVSEGGPRLVDTPDFPEPYKGEALAHAEVLEALRASGSGAEWFYVSPAAEFGAFAPGHRTGTYRTGGDVLLTDAAGSSEISGADFAIAFADEIEHPAHTGERFTVTH